MTVNNRNVKRAGAKPLPGGQMKTTHDRYGRRRALSLGALLAPQAASAA
jgi:hypothetical protein